MFPVPLAIAIFRHFQKQNEDEEHYEKGAKRRESRRHRTTETTAHHRPILGHQTKEVIMEKVIPPAIGFIWSLWHLPLLFILALCGCGTEPEPAPAFLGRWAAPWPDAPNPEGGPLLYGAEFRADHSVTFNMKEDGAEIVRHDGRWDYSAPFLVSRDTLCQEGKPLRLSPCPAKPDTVRPAISGDSWPVNFEIDGQVISINLKRVI